MACSFAIGTAGFDRACREPEASGDGKNPGGPNVKRAGRMACSFAIGTAGFEPATP